MTRLEFVIPIETDAQRAAAAKVEALALLTEGGFSRYEGLGAWNGGTERHVRIEVATSEPPPYTLVAKFLAELKNAGESAAYFLINGSPHLVTL